MSAVAWRRYQPGSLEGWLARIVTNVFLDEVRRRASTAEEALPDDPDRVLPSATGADERAGLLGRDPARAGRDRPRSSGFPSSCCDVADRTYDEIAGALGVPVGHGSARAHRPRPAHAPCRAPPPRARA